MLFCWLESWLKSNLRQALSFRPYDVLRQPLCKQPGKSLSLSLRFYSQKLLCLSSRLILRLDGSFTDKPALQDNLSMLALLLLTCTLPPRRPLP